jgi:Family of unknown function (DUF6876)
LIPRPRRSCAAETRTLEEQDAFYKELARFTRAANLYEHRTKLLAYSDGVWYLVAKTNAQWLLDLIAFAQPWALADPVAP